jgi:hypothetical protein
MNKNNLTELYINQFHQKKSNIPIRWKFTFPVTNIEVGREDDKRKSDCSKNSRFNFIF